MIFGVEKVDSKNGRKIIKGAKPFANRREVTVLRIMLGYLIGLYGIVVPVCSVAMVGKAGIKRNTFKFVFESLTGLSFS